MTHPAIQRPSRRAARGLFAVFLLAGCQATRPAQPILFSSEPPGALVLVDGERSGFATPCLVSLPIEKPHMIQLELIGYETPARYIIPDGSEEAVLWTEMNVGHRTPHFPLWLNIDDFFVTIVTHNPSVPSRIFVRLKRTVDSVEAYKGSEDVTEWVDSPEEEPEDSEDSEAPEEG